MVEQVDTLVIGAGVVGLALARLLARSDRKVVVLEEQDAVGTATSSRNSGVIHAGIYYPAGSRKARLCVRGRELLYAYCADRGVGHRRIGKLIVAVTAAQIDQLESVRRRGIANGVHDLRRLDERALGEYEPEVCGVAAILSPSTGIVDTTGLMHALHRDVLDAGGVVALRTALASAEAVSAGFVVELSDGTRLRCRELINCAGLGAWSVARSVSGHDARTPGRHLAKGNYFTVASGRVPFSRLVYPLPVDGGLGVHYTVDLDGRGRFGPDVEWVDRVDYRVDETRAAAFEAEIGQYWPALPRRSLVPDYAGIRPKISGPGEAAADFVIDGPAAHGIPGLVHLFGIESPGLTSCLAIAEEVERELRGTDR